MRIVIAEDQVLLREGLKMLFADGGHEVVATLGDADGLVAAVASYRPDLVVADIRMPPSFSDEGARAAEVVKTQYPEVGVLLLSQHIETTHVVGLVSLGGFGYLLKDRVLDVGEFLAAAERVARGGSALDPQVVAGLVARRGDTDPLAALTDRERDVLELMAEGLTNSGIARRLFLSERTVEAHVRHVFTKLGLPDSEDGHRRVLAVLTHLSAATPGRGLPGLL
ncbi:response regulator transcription factor [Kribbella swartbergensis]